jgi:cell division protein ZapA
MKNEAKSYKVLIFGDHYNLVSDEPEDIVSRSASLVDLHMREIAHKLPTLDEKKVAVLSAVRLASQLLSSQLECESNKNKQEALVQFIDQQILKFL